MFTECVIDICETLKKKKKKKKSILQVPDTGMSQYYVSSEFAIYTLYAEATYVAKECRATLNGFHVQHLKKKKKKKKTQLTKLNFRYDKKLLP